MPTFQAKTIFQTSETPQTYVLALAVEVRQCPLQVEPEGGKVEAEAGGGRRRQAEAGGGGQHL